MSAPGQAPPTAGGGRNPFRSLTAWAKRNKGLTLAGAAGGGFLLFSRMGQSGGGDGGTGDPATAEDAQFGTIVPVMRQLDDSADAPVSEDPPTYDDIPPEEPIPAEDPLPDETPPPTPAPASSAPRPAPAASAQGVSHNGHFFAGASSVSYVQTNNAPGGHTYQVYAVQYPGRREYWWFYTKGSRAGGWTGPHRSPGSGPRTPAGGSTPAPSRTAAPKPQSPKPTPTKPAAAPNHPSTRSWDGHPLSWWQNPSINKKGGKWRWPDGHGFAHSRRFEGR